MLRPYVIVLEPFPQFPNRLNGAWPGAPEQGARQQQEVPVAHRAHGAPFASLRKGGRHCRVGEHGDPLRIARDDRLERDLGGRRRDVAEDVARTGLRRQLIEVAAVADDDRWIIPDDERERSSRRWRRATCETVQHDRKRLCLLFPPREATERPSGRAEIFQPVQIDQDGLNTGALELLGGGYVWPRVVQHDEVGPT